MESLHLWKCVGFLFFFTLADIENVLSTFAMETQLLTQLANG